MSKILLIKVNFMYKKYKEKCLGYEVKLRTQRYKYIYS